MIRSIRLIEKHVLKKGLLIIIVFIINSICFGSRYLFPNEILYQNKSSVGVAYRDHSFDFFINTKFSVDTPFKFTVEDPIIAGLIQTESSFYVHAISESNALGPFQMKPFIATEIGAANPFNPYHGEKVSILLDRYQLFFGTIDNALGAYHIGYYGVKKMVDSGKNPMNDQRVNDYVQKNRSFQRLLKGGEKISFKDYIWLDCFLNLSETNQFYSNLVVPEFFIGSLALGVTNSPGLQLTFFQELTLSWFFNLYFGYDQGWVIGIGLNSNDWFDKITIRYDFLKDDLKWFLKSKFDFFSLDMGFSKNSILVRPAFSIKDRFIIQFPIAYEDFEWIPGISVNIRF